MYLRIWLLYLVGTVMLNAQSPQLECFVEFVGYNAQGQRLPPLEIVSAGPIDERYMLVNITAGFDNEPVDHRPVIQGNRLFFPRTMLGSSLVGVTVHAPDIGSGQKIVAMSACRQRESIFIGDVWPQTSQALYSTFRGRISGCNLVGHWWVRSELLFGNTQPYESSVSAETGEFLVLANGTAKHLIVIGRGSTPIKAFTRFYKGALNGVDLGVFEIGDACP